jgi:hypothetical protein
MSDVETEAAHDLTEIDRVTWWRFEVLFESGYPADLAGPLASSAVDLHRATDLLAQGCPPELAARILL